MRSVAVIGAAVIALTCLQAPLVVSADESACTQQEKQTGTCVIGEIDGDHVDITGTQPGSGSGPGNSGGGGGGNTQQPVDPDCPPAPALCVSRGEWGATATPTLADIVSFRPTPGVDHMEPNGWFVTGLDANFYATGGSSVVTGTLLGRPASVRFTPIRWAWTYGDGASATRSTKGGTWKTQGIHPFDPTPTSHVYDNPGTYYIDLTIGYRAEYSWDGSSYGSIVGTLWLPANRLVATVGGAKTVLVERDCAANPSGPGC